MNNKENLIRELIEVLDMADVASVMVKNIVKSFQVDEESPYVKMYLSDIEEFYENLIPIYDKYYSEEDIKLMLEFYKSDTAKKIRENASSIQKDANIAANNWMKSIKEKFESVNLTKK